MSQQSVKIFLVGVAAALVLCASLAPRADAQWNGNPIPANGGSATDNNGPNNVWSSTLIPNPAISAATCSWITNGLNAQGFNSAGGWTINWVALTGSLSLQTYYAWVTQQPTENINNTNFGGQGPFIDFGGADIRVLYTPGNGDPTGNSVNWIQGIYTNSPISGLGTNYYNAGGGYFEYLDNAGTYGTNPNYNNGVGANPTTSTGFLDIPARGGAPYTNVLWEAQVFVDTFNAGTKTINIYSNGVWWGYNYIAVPEPSTIVLLSIGAVGLVAVAWRRRQA